MPDSDLFYKSESGMITYLIQPVFRSDFYLTEIQARIESVYRLVSSYCPKILYHVCIRQEKVRSESDLNIIGCVFWLLVHPQFMFLQYNVYLSIVVAQT